MRAETGAFLPHARAKKLPRAAECLVGTASRRTPCARHRTPQRVVARYSSNRRERKAAIIHRVWQDCARERSATLAESPIDILLWEIPLNSHSAAPARADAQPH